MIDVKQTLSEGLKREYAIDMSADEIKMRVDQRIGQLAKDVKMPGFRPGKVPVSIVKTRYGQQVLGEIIESSLDEAVRKIISDDELHVASQPSLELSEYKEDGGLSATLQLEVMPEFEKIELSSLIIDKPEIEISESEIDEAVERIANENQPTKPIEEQRPAQLGDTVVIDYVGSIDNTPFEGGAAEGQSLELGSKTFIPGFEDGLVGATIGQKIDVMASFPDTYQTEHLAGKDAVFAVTIHEIREPDAVEIDDEFASSMGMENLAALKEAVRGMILRNHSTAIRDKVKTSILNALDEVVSKVELPSTLVEPEYDNICHAMHPHEHKKGDDDHSCDEGLSEAEKKEAREIAERRVRLGIVLSDIGHQNGLDVTQEERNRAVSVEAQRYPGQEKQVMDYFNNNPNAAQSLIGPIFEDKVMDYILEIAEVRNHIITVEELYGDDEDESAEKNTAAKKSSGAKKTATKKTAAKKATTKKAAKES